jgi:anti-anti-sigma factor
VSDPHPALRDHLRAALVATASLATEHPDHLESLLDEFAPFATAAEVALAAHDESRTDARTLAWLFAYRVGGLGLPPTVLHAVLAAWRDFVATSAAMGFYERMLPTMLEGFVRAREDHCHAELQRTLSAEVRVATLAAGLRLVTLNGPLDADTADAIAERVAKTLHRDEARAVIVDLSGLASHSPSVIAALWGIAASARMLGVAAVVVGDEATLASSLEALGSERSLCALVPQVADALDHLSQRHGITLSTTPSWRTRFERGVRDAVLRAQRLRRPRE